MKKYVLIAAAAMLILSLNGCGCMRRNPEPTDTTAPSATITPTAPTVPTVPITEPVIPEPTVPIPPLETNIPDPDVDQNHIMDDTQAPSEPSSEPIARRRRIMDR